MRINQYLSSLPAHQIRIYHLSDNWSGANNGYLYHNVVEVCGMKPRETGHLSAALDLKHADGIGFLQGAIDRSVVRRQLRQIDFFAVVIADKTDGIFQYGHHAKPQKIDLNNA